MMSGSDGATFPPQGRRLIIYRISATAGPLDDYVFIALRALQDHASHIVAALSTAPTPSDRARLKPLCNQIVVPDNTTDVALAEALASRMTAGERFDEVIVTDDSWFGPVCALEPVFDRMGRVSTHVWTMTQAGRPSADAWVAVRPRKGTDSWRGLLATAARAADEGLTSADTGDDGGEARDVPSAFTGRDGATEDPVLHDAHQLMAAGCPILARRVFDSDPPVLERYAVSGKRLLAAAARNGYESEVVLRSLARTVAPQQLNASLSLVSIPTMPAVHASPKRYTAVLAHFGSNDEGTELARRVAMIPGPGRIVATTASPEDVPRIRALLTSGGQAAERAVEVRVLPPTADRVSAVFVGCRDVLVEGGEDLVIALHTGAAVEGVRGNVRRYLGRHTWENLLASREHAAAVLTLFDEPGLGLVFPPIPHIGVDTLGMGWDGERPDAERFARLVGIGVPLGPTPLRPVGGMWIARPSALRSVTEREWVWSDYLPGSGWRSLARTQEAILTYAAGERGFHTRTVLTAEHASISHAPLEFKLDQLASTIPGSVAEKIALLQRLGPVGRGRVGDFVRMYRRGRGVDSSPGGRAS